MAEATLGYGTRLPVAPMGAAATTREFSMERSCKVNFKAEEKRKVHAPSAEAALFKNAQSVQVAWSETRLSRCCARVGVDSL